MLEDNLFEDLGTSATEECLIELEPYGSFPARSFYQAKSIGMAEWATPNELDKRDELYFAD